MSKITPPVKSNDLSTYAKITDLTNYAKTTELNLNTKFADLSSKLSGYAKIADLSYSKTNELNTKFADLNSKNTDLSTKLNDLNSKINTINTSLSSFVKTTDIAKKFNLPTCRKVVTEYAPDGNGSVTYLDRHTLKCNHNEYLTAFHLDRDSSKAKMRLEGTCCKVWD